MVSRPYLLTMVAVALVAVVFTLVSAETIRLKNGRVFEGEIIDETDDEVKIEIKSGIVYFSRDEIASIGDRKISQKDIKEAEKSLENQPVEKKPAPKKTTAPVSAAKPAPKKVQKPVKKIKVVKPITPPAVVVDTATVTPEVAVSTEAVVSMSTETLVTPALPVMTTDSTKVPYKPYKLTSPIAAVFIAICISAILLLAVIITIWKIFVKAGQPGWAGIIPVYNLYILIKIAGKPNWWLLFFFAGCIPYIGIIVYLVFSVILYISVARCFGKGAGFGVGLAFLPFIFMPILAFDKSIYTPPEDKTDKTDGINVQIIR